MSSAVKLRGLQMCYFFGCVPSQGGLRYFKCWYHRQFWAESVYCECVPALTGDVYRTTWRQAELPNLDRHALWRRPNADMSRELLGWLDVYWSMLQLLRYRASMYVSCDTVVLLFMHRCGRMWEAVHFLFPSTHGRQHERAGAIKKTSHDSDRIMTGKESSQHTGLFNY